MPKQTEPKKWKLINSWDALPGDEWQNERGNWEEVDTEHGKVRSGHKKFLLAGGYLIRRKMTPVEQNAPKVMAAMKKLLKAAEDWDNFDPDWILAEGNARKLMKELSRSRSI